MRAPMLPFVPDQFPPVMPDPIPAAARQGRMLSEVIADLPAQTPSPKPQAPSPQKGLSTPLTKYQKYQLSDLARHTFTYLQAHHPELILPGEKEPAFRRRIALGSDAHKRISQASHGDYKLIQAAFLTLKNQPRAADRAQAAAGMTALNIARHKLQEALRKNHQPESYATAIARRIYKRALTELTAKEVWTVIYTLNNNHNAAAGKGHQANRFKKLKAHRTAAKTA